MTAVLLIEDDDNLRDALSLALHRYGHVVTAAASGEAGLAALADGAPDIVVLDVMLPGVDGFEVCRRIRARSGVPSSCSPHAVRTSTSSRDSRPGDDYVVKRCSRGSSTLVSRRCCAEPRPRPPWTAARCTATS